MRSAPKEGIMQNKVISLLIAVIVIVIFSLFFVIQFTFYENGSPVLSDLERITECSEQDNWEQAAEAFERLKAHWGRQEYFLSFNYAEADFSLFTSNLASLRSAIQTRSKSDTAILTGSSIELLKNFVKLVPGP